MKEMRRKDRTITQEEAMVVLNRAEYGVLSTVSENGKPYGVPLNFCIDGHSIYFHCAVEGQKIDNINNNKSVSFCAVGRTEILPDRFSTKFESVIASGEADEVFDHEKQRALEGLVCKYSPVFMDQGKKYIEALGEKTRVFKIIITNLSGKARKK